MYQVLKLNGSAHKDLTQLVKAISKVRTNSPYKPVSVVISDDDHLQEKTHNQNGGNQPFKVTQIHSEPAEVSENQKPLVDVFVAGTGTVGGEFIRQLQNLEDDRVDFRIIGQCNSRQTTWILNDSDSAGHSFSQEAAQTERTDWSKIAGKLISLKKKNLVLIDATGNTEPVSYYRDFLKAGIHIVTPGKLANTQDQSFFDEITDYEKTGTFYGWEATAGAGLPVIQTIQNLKNSGDEIKRIQGVLSGTLTYIFSELERGVPFSQAVKKAAELGYSEPDPRDDLSGEDVARKFLILARAAGYKLERDEIRLENQIPAELLDVSKEVFLNQLPDYDDYWEKRVSEAAEKGEALRFVGELLDGEINISVRSVPVSSPAGRLSGTDNLVSIYTRYYDRSPLVIQGPGAGKEVTAQAVLNDLRQIALKTAVVRQNLSTPVSYRQSTQFDVAVSD